MTQKPTLIISILFVCCGITFVTSTCNGRVGDGLGHLHSNNPAVALTKPQDDVHVNKTQSLRSLTDITKHPAFKVAEVIEKIVATAIGSPITITKVFKAIAKVVDGQQGGDDDDGDEVGKLKPSLWAQIEEMVDDRVRDAIGKYHNTNISNRLKSLKDRLEVFRKTGESVHSPDDQVRFIEELSTHLHETVNRVEYFFDPTQYGGNLMFDWGFFHLYFNFVTHKIFILTLLKSQCEKYQSDYEKLHNHSHDYAPFLPKTYDDYMKSYKKKLKAYAGDLGTVVSTAKKMYWTDIHCEYDAAIVCRDRMGNEYRHIELRSLFGGGVTELRPTVDYICFGREWSNTYERIAIQLWNQVQLPILKAIGEKIVPGGKSTVYNGRPCDNRYRCFRYDIALPAEFFPGNCETPCRNYGYDYKWCHDGDSWHKC